jgi:hypothetical protein
VAESRRCRGGGGGGQWINVDDDDDVHESRLWISILVGDSSSVRSEEIGQGGGGGGAVPKIW